MKRFLAAIVGCFMMLATAGGCANAKVQETRAHYFNDTLPKYMAVNDAYAQVAGKTARAKFLSDKMKADDDWSDWKERHTSAKGTLFELANDGSELPMRTATLDAVLEGYTKELAAISEEENRWNNIEGTYNAIRDEFLTITGKQQALETEWAETQQRMQQFGRDALGSLGALSIGIGLNAL